MQYILKKYVVTWYFKQIKIIHQVYMLMVLLQHFIVKVICVIWKIERKWTLKQYITLDSQTSDTFAMREERVTIRGLQEMMPLTTSFVELKEVKKDLWDWKSVT